MQERRVVNDTLGPAGPFSTAVVGGGLIFVSGLSGAVEDGKLSGSDIQSQARRVLDRLRGVLEQAGASLGGVVSVYVYLRRAEDFEPMNAIYRRVLRRSAARPDDRSDRARRGRARGPVRDGRPAWRAA